MWILIMQIQYWINLNQAQTVAILLVLYMSLTTALDDGSQGFEVKESGEDCPE